MHGPATRILMPSLHVWRMVYPKATTRMVIFQKNCDQAVSFVAIFQYYAMAIANDVLQF